MKNTRALLVWLLGLALAMLIEASGNVAAAERKPLWLAVGRADLVKPLKALVEKRQGEGFTTVVTTKTIDEALAGSPRPDFLLLVGDYEPGEEQSPWYLPAKRITLYRWRKSQSREYLSDAAWGDFDGDGVPDIPVGRIPARTPAQVEMVVQKILAFEAQRPIAADLQLAAWLGSPEYGAAINALSSGFGVSMIHTNGPAWSCPWFVSGNTNDPFRGWPPDQPLRFMRRMKKGGIIGVLIGHASHDTFFSMKFEDRLILYRAGDAAKEFSTGPPVPPMIFLSCNSGDFGGPTPSLADSLLFLSGGPVATIAASTESHPLTNYFSGACLLKALSGREKRLGAIWLNAQHEAKQSRNFIVEAVLRDVEGSLDDEIDVQKLRHDQILMYNLFGDPAMQLRLPDPLPATVERTESGWRWKASRPPGVTHLEVGFREAQPISMVKGGKPEGREKSNEAAETANAQFTFATLPSPPAEDPWEGTVNRPGWLRLVASGANGLYAVVLKLQ